MRHITIAIHLPSQLLRLAIEHFISRQREIPATIIDVVQTAAGWECQNMDRPTLLLCDALNSPDSLIHDAKDMWECPIIGLVSGILSPDNLRKFSETVSIYEPIERMNAIIRQFAEHSETHQSAKELSPREKEVVKLIVKGKSNKEIASIMNVSANTVMTHRRNISSKLQIHSAAGLTIYAIVSKLVTLEDAREAEKQADS